VANRNQPGCACCGNYDCDNPGQFAISMNASEISCVAATSICRRSDDGFNCCACVVINPFTSGCREMLCSGVGFPDTFAAQFTFSGTAQHKYYTAGQGAEIVPVAGDPPAYKNNQRQADHHFATAVHSRLCLFHGHAHDRRYCTR
jgi:hypothetical protein